MYLRLWDEPVTYEQKPVKEHFTLALKWFDKATEQDDPTAQFNLAALSAKLAERLPEGSKKSTELYKRVVIWYKKAAEQNYAPAQFHLA